MIKYDGYALLGYVAFAVIIAAYAIYLGHA